MKKAPERRGMRPVRKWFGDVLPPDYARKTSLINQFQAFFHSLQDDPVYACVEVLAVDERQLTLAVPSPGLVNYLRLHTREIGDMIEQQFGCRLQLRMIVQPGASAAGAESARRGPARYFAAPVAEQLERSAAAVEDQSLRDALIRLARAIRDG